MKKLLVFLAMSIFLVSCTTETPEKISDMNSDSKIKITATLPPLASIAKYIGGENIEVNSIIEPGFSPHTFDLKPSHIKQIAQADIILSTGLDIDNFLLENKSEKIVELKDYVDLLEGHEHHHDHSGHEDEHHEDEHHEDEHHEDEHHEDEHHEESIYYDPHFWLSLENGNKIAEEIKNSLIKIDSKNIELYETNYLEFISESNKIKAKFSQEIETKKLQHFAIFHEAYNYLFKEFGIDEEYVIVLEETAGREPSVGEMKNILDTITINNITVIYKEPQFSSKLIDTLVSHQYNLEVKVLDPLGTSINKNNYFETVQQNLNNLKFIYE